MQYAVSVRDFCRVTQAGEKTATSLELGVLKLGLEEFPGSALLQLRAVDVQLRQQDDDSTRMSHGDKIAAIQTAIDAVGKGSHRNEDFFTVALYRLLAVQTAKMEDCDDDDGNSNNNTNQVADVWIQRSQTPMRDSNAELTAEFGEFWAKFKPTGSSLSMDEIMSAMEEGRRQEAKLFGRFTTYEDDIDVALHREGILTRNQPEFMAGTAADLWNNEAVDWDKILRPGDQKYGMGYGGGETATAFVKYAHALKQFRLPKDSDDVKDDGIRLFIETRVQSLAFAVYERGVAECPTVEFIWLSYIRDLQHWIVLGQRSAGNKDMAATAASRMQKITARACRNCPYSVALMQQKLLAVLLVASTDDSTAVVDPDQLLEDVSKGFDTKFLPNEPAVCLDLYVTALRVVKRRILFLLAGRVQSESQQSQKKNKKQQSKKQLAYDDSEPLPNPKNGQSHGKVTPNADEDDDEALQEVQDLLEDLSEMYDEVESRLRKSHASWTEGRALLWKDRAQSMSLLQNPLHAFFSEETNRSAEYQDLDELLQSFEKSVRFHNPPHPDLYALYIRQYIATISFTPASTAEEVLVRIRRVRFLFEKALSAVGKAKPQDTEPLVSTAMPLRDYETALSSLCNDWLDFERTFGSERSVGKASKIVEKKLQKASRFAPSQPERTSQPGTGEALPDKASEKPLIKRKHDEAIGDQEQLAASEDHEDSSRPSKKTKAEDRSDGPTEEKRPDAVDSKTGEEIKAQQPLHKVRVGKMEYPAHPYTVRVSNLSVDVEDMDLVDLFRPKCGAIVHAKIIREKQQHQQQHRYQEAKAKSKGWGLIQFEELESVEKALALDDVVGLHERLVKVERSHLPAVSLVPPGMHRVRPKGEGKASKRNQKRRERLMSEDGGRGAAAAAPETGAGDGDNKKARLADTTKDASSAAGMSALSFRPRGVGRSGHQKPRLQLDKK